MLEQPTADGSTRPVGFWSRKLADGQRKTWTAREKETYAIVEALRKWSGSIGLQQVVVLTDHQALQHWYTEAVDTPSGPTGRRARWHELLSKFNLSVQYVPGPHNTVADAMSRWPYPASMGYNDCSRHGTAEDAQQVREMEEQDEADMGPNECHVQSHDCHAHVPNFENGAQSLHIKIKCSKPITSNPQAAVQPVSRKQAKKVRIQVPEPDTASSSTADDPGMVPGGGSTPTSVLYEDWGPAYSADAAWGQRWQSLQAGNEEQGLH